MDEQSRESLGAEIKNAEEVINKLKKFTEALDKTNNDNILTHLCSGLETFLGFNSDSKGYDGHGIVYSDLDRLCDAVMGFLSGVLSNIHKHLGQHKETITPVIKLLEQNKHRGKNGFNVAIGEVVKGVGRYNEGVRKGNLQIKMPIDELLKFIKKDKDGMFIKTINEIQVTSSDDLDLSNAASKADELAHTCIRRTKHLDNELINAKTIINDLNSDCNINVNRAHKNVSHEAKRLEALTKKEWEDLVRMEREIKNVMKELRVEINKAIDTIVKQLVEGVKQKVEAIMDKLRELSMLLYSHIRTLDSWMEDTKLSIDKTKKKYVDTIIKDASSDEHSLKGSIKDVVIAINKEFQQADEHARTLLNDALKCVKDLDDSLKKDLYKVKTAVENKVTGIRTAIGKLYGVVASGAVIEDATKDKEYIAVIIKHIQEQVGKILNGPSTYEPGVQGVAVNFDKYAGNFKTKFETAIRTMIQRMVSSEGAVQQYIDEYVGDATTRTQPNKSNVYKVKEALKRYIEAYVRQLVKVAAERTEFNGIQDIGQLMRKLEIFSQYFEGYLIYDWNVRETLTGAVEDVKKEIEAGWYHSPSNTAPLVPAVKVILAAIHSGAMSAATELQTFIKTSDISKIKTVSEITRQLDNRLQLAINMSSADQQSMAAAVDNAIKEVSSTLEEHLKMDDKNRGTHIIFPTDDNKFQGYNGFVNQNADRLMKDPENLKGTLPEKIKQLGYNGFDTFKANLGVTKSTEDHNVTGFLKQITDNLEALTNSILEASGNLSSYLTHINDIKIDTTLTNIRNKINDIRNGLLTQAVNDADQFIKTGANTLRDIAIDSLGRHVNGYVLIAEKTLTTAARRNYVTSVKQLLTAFADKVSEELKGLPGEIERDLTIGYKGLMKTLEDGNIVPGALHKNIEKLTEVKNAKSDTGDEKKEAFKKLADKFKDFAEPLFLYLSKEAQRVHSENNAKKNPRGTDLQQYSDHISKIHDALNKLLNHLNREHRYDHNVHNLLDNVSTAVTALLPNGFAQPNTPLIDGLTSGLKRFVGELDKVYISAYDGQKYEKDVYIYKQHIDTKGKTDIYELTPYGKNCANIFLTILPTLFYSLRELRITCNKLGNFRSIYASTMEKDNALGDFFSICGYKVASGLKMQDGELRNSSALASSDILVMTSSPCNLFTRPVFSDDDGTLKNLCGHLDTYYEVRHHATLFAKKRPCSILEMLCWMSGLPCNPVHDKLQQSGLSEPFEDPSKQKKEVGADHAFTFVSHESLYLEASPKTIRYDNTVDVVRHLCSISHDILTTLLGYGDAETTYAVDFSSNAMNLHYPQKGEDCLQMLLDILSRLLPQLRYLHEKCKLSTEHGGWYSCKYGKVIKTSKWPCTDHSSDEPNDKATCQPKSPLQSYLNDCLPGHLPHRVESIGCNAVCKTCPKSTPGMPCLTPLGFRGFSGSTKKGKDICRVLSKFLKEVDISCLFALSVKPPRTLPEHFGFTLSLVNGWHISRSNGLKNAIQDAFENDIGKQSIGLVNKRGSLTDALRDAYGRSQENHIKHEDNSADLSSVSMSRTCTGKLCAPYISTSCVDIYNYLPYKHAGLYLSWAIYLPWTFWDLLNNLYNAFCSINCQDWGCRGCLRGDKCKKGEHGVVDEEKKSAICQCRSIVDCKGVAPTLYQYGFVFGEASTLNDKTSPKKCSDFCSQLKKVLESQYLQNLFKECDNFLWKIREPFSYLVLALWLLSLLYLIHIMVIRLDLLHIKSHLHSPSSHRIAAQSLLAAARVNKLNRVFYLQP